MQPNYNFYDFIKPPSHFLDLKEIKIHSFLPKTPKIKQNLLASVPSLFKFPSFWKKFNEEVEKFEYVIEYFKVFFYYFLLIPLALEE